jgi:hypothetical protein
LGAPRQPGTQHRAQAPQRSGVRRQKCCLVRPTWRRLRLVAATMRALAQIDVVPDFGEFGLQARAAERPAPMYFIEKGVPPWASSMTFLISLRAGRRRLSCVNNSSSARGESRAVDHKGLRLRGAAVMNGLREQLLTGAGWGRFQRHGGIGGRYLPGLGLGLSGMVADHGGLYCVSTGASNRPRCQAGAVQQLVTTATASSGRHWSGSQRHLHGPPVGNCAVITSASG